MLAVYLNKNEISAMHRISKLAFSSLNISRSEFDCQKIFRIESKNHFPLKSARFVDKK